MPPTPARVPGVGGDPPARWCPSFREDLAHTEVLRPRDPGLSADRPRSGAGIGASARGDEPQWQALLLTAVPGRGVTSLPLTPARQRAVQRQAGAWLSRFHGGPRDLSPQDHAEAAAEVARAVHGAERHLESAEDLIGERERETVRRHAAELTRLDPLPRGYVHGDFQERNWLFDTGPGRLAVVDLERARPHAVVFDIVRLACGPWVGRPDLRAAFFEGYGRELADKEERSFGVWPRSMP